MHILLLTETVINSILILIISKNLFNQIEFVINNYDHSSKLIPFFLSILETNWYVPRAQGQRSYAWILI